MELDFGEADFLAREDYYGIGEGELRGLRRYKVWMRHKNGGSNVEIQNMGYRSAFSLNPLLWMSHGRGIDHLSLYMTYSQVPAQGAGKLGIWPSRGVSLEWVLRALEE